MCRLLIADDEDLVRRGLATLIEREAPGIEIVGTAVDGLDALELAQRSRPDIVLTDIRMPGLNGLDLIQRLHAAHAGLRCIILSGYDEFDYARRAISLGVAEYLLKPVDPDDLLALLARTQEQIAAARQEHEARAAALRLATEQQLRRLLGGLEVDRQALGAALPVAAAWALLLVQLLPLCDDAWVPGDRDAPALTCHATLPGAVVVEDAYGYLCALAPLDRGDENSVAALARRLHERLRAAHGPVALTAARPCAGLEQIAQVYHEAIEVAEYHCMGAGHAPLLAWEVLPVAAERWPALPVAHRDALLDAIARGSTADAERAARAFTSYVHDHVSIAGLRTLWFEMIVLVIHHVQQFGVRADALLDAPYDHRSFLAGTANAGQLSARFVELIVRAARECARLQQQHAPRGTIAELRAYIENHPADDLAITRLAQRMHLNAKYLGELFKQVSGEPLGEFIIRTRMRRACELLADSSLRVYAVAEQVGYSSPKHFATMFRAVVGLSPAEYRQQQRRGLEPQAGETCQA